VVCGCAWQRGQFVKVHGRRFGDSDDQLARVGLAVETAKQFVADCVREPLGGACPVGENLARGGKRGELDARALACDRCYRPAGRDRRRRGGRRRAVGTSRGYCPCLSG
jgi:hypothetical protein